MQFLTKNTKIAPKAKGDQTLLSFRVCRNTYINSWTVVFSSFAQSNRHTDATRNTTWTCFTQHTWHTGNNRRNIPQYSQILWETANKYVSVVFHKRFIEMNNMHGWVNWANWGSTATILRWLLCQHSRLLQPTSGYLYLYTWYQLLHCSACQPWRRLKGK